MLINLQRLAPQLHEFLQGDAVAEAPADSSGAGATGAQPEAAGQQEHHRAPTADAAGPSWAAWRGNQSGEVCRDHPCLLLLAQQCSAAC